MEGYVDTTQSDKAMWLMKCPSVVSRYLQPCSNPPNDAPVAKVIVSIDPLSSANDDSTKLPWGDAVRSTWTDSPKSMLPVFKELIAAGVQIWVFSGDTDAVLPLTSTRYSINALNLTTTTEWYPWYDSGKVGGWSQVYDGLTYVTVRGAGHEVPLTRPELALVLFQHFLRNQSMPQITTKD